MNRDEGETREFKISCRLAGGDPEEDPQNSDVVTATAQVDIKENSASDGQAIRKITVLTRKGSPGISWTRVSMNVR